MTDDRTRIAEELTGPARRFLEDGGPLTDPGTARALVVMLRRHADRADASEADREGIERVAGAIEAALATAHRPADGSVEG